MEFTAEIIAGFLGGEIVGNPEAKVHTLAKIEEGAEGALSFLSNPKYEQYIYSTKSSIVIVATTFTPTAPITATLVKVEDPYASFAKLLELYIANKPQKTGISSMAVIASSAKVPDDCYVGEFAVISQNATIGKNCKIYPQVYIGDNVKIGDDAIIFPGVKIYEECVIGNRVTMHAGVIIGADGFGFAPTESGEYNKIPQIGNVIIEDDVEIGANTCIDRATMGSTVIHRGAKLDNLIQIGHNATVGTNTVAAAQLGLAGSSKIGNNCMIGGQVGISGHLSIGNKVQIGPKSGLTKSVPDDTVIMGYPAMTISKFRRANISYRNMPETSLKVDKLEKEVKRLSELIEKLSN